MGAEIESSSRSDDVCSYVRKLYDAAVRDDGITKASLSGMDSGDWEYLKEVYGKDAAQEIMDARTRSPAAEGYFTGAVIDACGEAP